MNGPKPLHDWESTSAKLTDDYGMSYELFVCRRCKAHGRRYGINTAFQFSRLCQ